VDEREMDRIDMKHRLYTMLLDEQLFLAPIISNPQVILDLGTGSGALELWVAPMTNDYSRQT
jgi:methylase of polypeptide subunit release factors